MNKNCFFKLFVVITTCLIVSVSCSKEQHTHIDIGGGDFYAINLSSKDTIIVKGGIQGGSSLILYAGIDDDIKLSFTPKVEYKDKAFAVTYSFSNSTKREGQGKDYSIIFKVNEFDVESNSLVISMSALHESKDWSINATGNIDVRIRK